MRPRDNPNPKKNRVTPPPKDGRAEFRREWPRGRANAPRDVPGHALRSTRKRF